MQLITIRGSISAYLCQSSVTLQCLQVCPDIQLINIHISCTRHQGLRRWGEVGRQAGEHQRNAVNNDVGQHGGILLPGLGDVGIAAEQRLAVVFALAVPRQPDLAQPRHARLAHLRAQGSINLSQSKLMTEGFDSTRHTRNQTWRRHVKTVLFQYRRMLCATFSTHLMTSEYSRPDLAQPSTS